MNTLKVLMTGAENSLQLKHEVKARNQVNLLRAFFLLFRGFSADVVKFAVSGKTRNKSRENKKMGQETKDTIETGSNLPNSDGTVSDEDVNAITDDGSDKPTGQDHSTEDREETIPDSGVGAIQDSNDTTSDIASIDD